ncbi:ABC transporter substrate-binding protein [Spirochaeta cellobiosiphila]|uniref:ABC transporter substrate-binding protein n=1 Tax=Spirochaeta cellobiosiphila TaxID=504483 RepID=UPI00040FDBAF|nr:ABC transporter substrate-binding protein [Spirochaeta cellobiosiphila]
MKRILTLILALMVFLMILGTTSCQKKDDMSKGSDKKVVTMAGPFTDNDAVKFEESIKAFEEETGIDIQYEGSKEFEASISVRIEGGNPPDIADFPQPGLLENFVKTGKVIDLSKTLDMTKVRNNYIQSWLDMGTMTGPDGPIMAGLWARVNLKGIVWYNKKAFDAAGYKVPTTWAELESLMEQIKSDGDAPWAIGIESGAATGWTATDWTEQLMLRTTSLENYDRWLTGDLKFDSPEVRTAIQTWSDIWFPEGNVYGGRKSIPTTSFGDSAKVLFEEPPKAWLHDQGNFIVSFFPEGLQPGVDYDFFNLPPVNDTYGAPLLVGGDIYAMFNDRPEVRQVMQYFASAQSIKTWLASGGVLAPQKDVDPNWLTNPVDRRLQELLKNAKALRFDGSDLMPGAVGAGSFWKEMTGYVSGSRTLDQAVKAIDASWPN